MAVVSVIFNGTRINSSDTSTNWGNWGTGGPAPAAESPIAYQGGLAVNKKINSTTLGGFDYDPGAGAVDMTAAANKLWFIKAIASDSFDLNATFGMAIGIGSANNAFYKYNVAGTGAALTVYDEYPVQGGYLITSLDPNIAAWRDGTGTGTPTLTAIDWFGIQAAFIVGAAKAENLALDAIDVGTGLSLAGGDGADPDATFQDFVVFDQDNTSNRYGVVTGAGDAIVAHGLLTIGTGATATVFNDTESILTFADGYHSRGLVGVLVNLNNVSTDIDISTLLIGQGGRNGVDANDTRPDFEVVGTTGAFDFDGTMRNFRDITFTSACTIDGATIEGHLLVQGGSEIKNTTLNTNSLTSVAFLQDPTFGTTSGLHDVDFIQTGVGHAIEIDTAGSYDFNNITFDGYGATASDSAAIDVTETTGTVTINVIGGTSPTYKTAGATVVIVVNPVTFLITVKDISTNLAIQNARVKVEVTDGTNFPYLDSVTITSSGTLATVTHTAHGLTTNDFITIRGTNETPYLGCYPITVTGVNTYTYTMTETTTSPATGTITATFAYFNTLTDINGQVTDTRSIGSNQAVTGKVRKSTTSPLYRSQPISETVTNVNGLSLNVLLISDE